MRGPAIGWLLTAVVLSGCQSAPESFPAVSDGMSCPEVVEVVEAALERGQRFVAAEESDALLASDLVFALSGADERPECLPLSLPTFSGTVATAPDLSGADTLLLINERRLEQLHGAGARADVRAAADRLVAAERIVSALRERKSAVFAI